MGLAGRPALLLAGLAVDERRGRPRLQHVCHLGSVGDLLHLFFPVGILLVRRLDQGGLPLVATVPVVWVALEFFRSHFATGFGWYLLGHTQHDFLPVIQTSDLGGVYLVSALVAAVNALIFEVLATRSWFRTLFGLPVRSRPGRICLTLSAVVVLVLLAADLSYGAWRLGQETFTPGPCLALVQGSVPQSTRNTADNENSQDAPSAAKDMALHYCRVAELGFRCRPDLLVWPETSLPYRWVEHAQDETAVPTEESLSLARDVTKEWPTNHLLGLGTLIEVDQGRDRRYNSSVLIHANGQPAGRYDKIHLVPFGEYIPFRSWVPFLNIFSPYDFDYSVSPGQQMTRFPLGPYHFGVVICYEDTDATLARRYVQPGDPPVDFLLNTTNDGWFNGTSEHEQHLAISRFRAIETLCSLARAVNMGISAFIDSNGRVLAPKLVWQNADLHLWQIPKDGATALPAHRWKEFKKTQGVVTASIPIDHRASVYARWGDWLPWTCWVLLAVGLVGLRFRPN